jgi:hypothetical protein
MTFEYSPAWPHGEIEEVFPDIFFVTGTNRTHHAGVDLQTSRGMVAVRERDGLVLVNTVRLDDDGLRKLESLGRIAHVVRLGAFHGRDDPFYRDRYKATLWALPESMHADGHEADHTLVPHRMLPLRDAELFVFESAKYPEAALLLRRDGGILITCDAVQNWVIVDRYFSPETGAQFMAQGLIRPANIPSTWLGACEPDASDFRRLLALEFRHLVSAHGEPLLRDAHSRLSMRAAEIFEEL